MAAFFFIIMGIKPVVRRSGAGVLRRHCPNCGDWRNFQETTWRNYFSVFFIPLFPVGAPQTAYTCASCGLPLGREAAAEPAPLQEAGPSPAGETLVVQCPRCDGRMRVPLRERGFTAVCPHCTLEFKVKGQREDVPEALVKE